MESMKTKKRSILLSTLLIGISLGLLGGFISASQEESYRVINVRGVIKNITQGGVLRRGMDVYDQDELVFTDSQDKAIVISSQKGRYVLAPDINASEVKTPSEIQTFLFSVLLPIKKGRELDFRSIDDEIYDLAYFFGEKEFMILGEQLRLHMNGQKYATNHQQYFVFRYLYKGKAYNKKLLLNEENRLILKEQELFKDREGYPIPSEAVDSVSFYWYVNSPQPGKRGAAQKLTTVHLEFMDSEELKADFEEFIRFEGDSIPSSDEEKYTHLMRFFLDAYGNTDPKYLKGWLKEQGF